MRVACLLVPDFPLVAVLRAEPSLVGEPLAVVEAREGGAPDGRRRLLGATCAAEGVRPGQLLAQAQALCPSLKVRPASCERLRAAAQAAIEAAGSIAPRVEEEAPGLVYLDVSGLEKLIGDEPQVAGALLRASERVGLCAAVGLAQGKRTAQLAAHAAATQVQVRATRSGIGGGALHIVPPGKERAFLAKVPLASLAPSSAFLEAARRFGLSTLGELARLPRAALAARLGAEGSALQRIARGEDEDHLVARPLPERFEEGDELEWSAGTVEPLLFVWKALLQRLSSRLSARGLAAAELSLSLRLESGAWDVRDIALAAPSREVGPLLSLLRLSVEGRPPGEGVCAVRLSALPTVEVEEQLGLFGPRTASPAALSTAVARIAALVGPDRVGKPAAVDTHRPNAFSLEKFAPPPPPPAEGEAGGPVLASRAQRPLRPAEVRCDGEGRPRLVIGEGALGGRVVDCAGPFRTMAEWWTETPVALDAFDVELQGGLLLRVARELDTDAWWIESIYD